MKKAKTVVFSILLALCLALLCGCENGLVNELVQNLPGQTKQAEFHTYYDYGFHQPGKATLLMDGSTVFVDEALIAGDVVTVYYTGEMYVQESYPSTVVFQNGQIEHVEVKQAQTCILLIVQDEQTGEKYLVNNLYGTRIETAPDYVLYDRDEHYIEWTSLNTGTTLYGTYTSKQGSDPTVIAGLYTYLPR